MRSIDALVGPLRTSLLGSGFEGKSRLWTRRSGALLDVVAIRIRKSGIDFTADVAVLDSVLYELCWGMEPPERVEVARCTVQATAGSLALGRERYWEVAEPASSEQVRAAVIDYGLPFLDQMHSPTRMETYLESQRNLFGGYAPPAIYLAGLKARNGNTQEACRICAGSSPPRTFGLNTSSGHRRPSAAPSRPF